MRLLFTSTLKLKEFTETIPRYAIISHTWGDDEFTYSDLSKPDRQNSAGYAKIRGCCSLAASEGWEYLWIDTCCIDKSSSAELTEAINSMWKWYKNSEICYVYLADFSMQNRYGPKMEQSRWFTRGWTLQELLVPKRVVFYDRKWVEIGSKRCLEQLISRICRISPDHLKDPTDASIAAKMSWASYRKTTREEDRAYSLLGLFDISMPLLYGEGEKAFFRLQCEIIQQSSDESIFAWRDGGIWSSGLLARSPSAFANSGDIVPQVPANIYQLPRPPNSSGSKVSESRQRPPYHMTNRGLEIELDLMSDLCVQWRWWAALNCGRASQKGRPVVLAFREDGGAVSRSTPCFLEFLEEPLKSFLNKTSETVMVRVANTNKEIVPLNLPEMWLPTLVRLAPAVRDEFHFYSPAISPVWDDGHLSCQDSLREQSEEQHLRLLHFQGFIFKLSWIHRHGEGLTQFNCEYSGVYQRETKGELLKPMSDGLNLLPHTLIGTGNHSVALDSDRDLWIKTRHVYEGRYPRLIVDIDFRQVSSTRSLFERPMITRQPC